MRRALWLIALAGCGGGEAAGDLGVVVDARAGAAIGAPCTGDDGCAEGNTPACFVSTLFNQSGVLHTDSGYCSSRCTTDHDCGAAGHCVDFGTFGAWCFAACDEGVGCRSGYACFYSPAPHCFPSGNLSCDPNAGDGSCTTIAGAPGGCIRYAIGPGTTGRCERTCQIGAGTCGANEQCILWHAAGSFGGTAQNRFIGAICVSTTTPAPSGAACAQLSACVDGDECFSSKLLTAGDDLCHALCSPSGDGGVGCAAATGCNDVFGLFDGGQPIGLCL